MLPEISRRCLSCGAAVRAGARFCPQCGQSAGDEPAAPPPHPASETREAQAPREVEMTREVAPPPREVEAPPRAASTTRDWTPPTKEFAAFAQSFDRPGVRQPQQQPPSPPQQQGAGEPPPSEAVAGEVPVEVPAAGAAPRAARGEDGGDGGAVFVAETAPADGAPGERGRVARVRDGTRARVGKIREEAIVVLEETPDDSGLRFVFAAAVLFAVFLLLLFLSTTVLR